MLFLMNDVVLNIANLPQPPLAATRFRAMGFPFVCELGQELFAEDALLPRNDLERASRLACLILAKAPQINAALFVAPAANCPPSAVDYRFATLDVALLASLAGRQESGHLTPYMADRQVWKRMAA